MAILLVKAFPKFLCLRHPPKITDLASLVYHSGLRCILYNAFHRILELNYRDATHLKIKISEGSHKTNYIHSKRGGRDRKEEGKGVFSYLREERERGGQE